VPRTLPFLLPALAIGLWAPAAPAAESYDNCTGTIAALPAATSTQGTWCLKGDLGTDITTGAAITVATNNVTIDCNGFKLGGLAAGDGTEATGIHAPNRRNVTVRNCNIRGFFRGVHLTGEAGGGHQVEDNMFDGNTFAGIDVQGDGSVVQRNRVRDTGGSTQTPIASGIRVTGTIDVLGNSVAGVFASDSSDAHGILTIANAGGSINGNRVSMVLANPGTAYGIYNPFNGRMSMRDNDLSGPDTGIGVSCTSDAAILRDNTLLGFATGNDGCTNGGGNVFHAP